MDQSKLDLRLQMRRRRRSLSPADRAWAAENLARRLRRTGVYRRSRDVAVYWSADGEMDLGAFIRRAWRDGKRIYLPVLAGHGRQGLWFRRYTPDSLLRPNHYGIPEPARENRAAMAARRLDLVLTPLVAFDAHGHRLGMGGGYYDRTFAFLHHRSRWQHPRLIGVAYSFQEAEVLPAEPWDVPLWGVCTEAGLRAFRRPG